MATVHLFDPDVNNFAKELTCAICLSVFHDPVEIEGCGHLFCRACVLPVATSSSSASRKCPECRVAISAATLVRPHRAIMNMLNALEGKCSECEWRGTYESFRAFHAGRSKHEVRGSGGLTPAATPPLPWGIAITRARLPTSERLVRIRRQSSGATVYRATLARRLASGRSRPASSRSSVRVFSDATHSGRFAAPSLVGPSSAGVFGGDFGPAPELSPSASPNGFGLDLTHRTERFDAAPVLSFGFGFGGFGNAPSHATSSTLSARKFQRFCAQSSPRPSRAGGLVGAGGFGPASSPSAPPPNGFGFSFAYRTERFDATPTRSQSSADFMSGSFVATAPGPSSTLSARKFQRFCAQSSARPSSAGGFGPAPGLSPSAPPNGLGFGFDPTRSQSSMDLRSGGFGASPSSGASMRGFSDATRLMIHTRRFGTGGFGPAPESSPSASPNGLGHQTASFDAVPVPPFNFRFGGSENAPTRSPSSVGFRFGGIGAPASGGTSAGGFFPAPTSAPSPQPNGFRFGTNH